MTVDEYAWPLAELGEAIAEMGRRTGLAVMAAALPGSPPSRCATDPSALADWLDQTAAGLGLETEAVETSYARMETLLRHSPPALLRLPTSGAALQGAGGTFLALLGSRGERLRLLGPDGKTHWVAVEAVRLRLCGDWEAPLLAGIDALLNEAEMAESRRASVRTALLNEQLADAHLSDCWLLRSAPSASLWEQARHSKLLGSLGIAFAADILYQALLLLSWAMIGQGALQGHFEWGWLWAWALLLFSLIPVQTVVAWAQQRLLLESTLLLRQRLLYGALRLDPESVRHGGVGYFLDRVLDVEALEGLVLSGGFGTLLAGVQLATAGVVLYLGMGGGLHVALLLLVVLYTLLAGWFYYRRFKVWDEAHRELTTDLVEQMVGHRTRLAQEAPSRRHADEDRLLVRYLKASERRDTSQLFLGNAIPQAWLLLGLAWLSYQALTQPASATTLAVSVGGVLLAGRSLGQLVLGAASLVRALVAWQEIAPLAQAADSAPGIAADPGLAARAAEQSAANGQRRPEIVEGIPLLTGHQVSFRYRADDTPVLAGCDISISVGERLLLEGPSGGGKSTLAGLLAGVRRPDNGLLLLNGYDQQTLGEENWRRQAVLAPQFHENFIFTGTLAFNLLLGRGWPPAADDLHEAEAVCRELGLGDLLDRMPGGLMQEVGESGWQLSHGERSRLFMARALLQEASLLVLDESFAALDPESLEQALRCVWRRVPTLVVIAHP
jgi:ATP-binding cassette subfamily B protein